MSWATGATWRLWLNVVLAAGCGLGCLGKSGIPEDPLFVSRKPIESKATTAAPVAVAFVEPPVPESPETALASAKGKAAVPGKKNPSVRQVPGILTSQPGATTNGSHLPDVKPQ